MRRVFTVEDEESVSICRSSKETLSQLFLVAEVQGTLDVSTVVLILETAVDDGFLIIQVIISTVQHLDKGFMVNAGKTLRLVGREVGELE